MSFYDALLFSKGQRGERGYSAYEIAVQEGYEGTEEEWANSFLSPTGYYTKTETDNKLKKKAYYFDNVASMKSATNLQNGDYVITLGYYETNDGGNGNYTVVNDINLVDNDATVIDLQNGLKAILIINGSINVKTFGAKGDDTNDDTIAIQKAIDYAYDNNIREIYLPHGKYKTTKPLFLYDDLKIYGVNCSSTIIHKATNDSSDDETFTEDAIIILTNRNLDITTYSFRQQIRDLKLLGNVQKYVANKENKQYAIFAKQYTPKTTITDFLIGDVDYGIYVQSMYTGLIQNCSYLKAHYGAIGVFQESQGLNIQNINTGATHEFGIKLSGGSYSTLSNILIEWNYGNVCYDLSYWIGNMLNCGAEQASFSTAVKLVQSRVSLVGGFFNASREDEDLIMFDLNDSTLEIENTAFALRFDETPYSGMFAYIHNKSSLILNHGCKSVATFTKGITSAGDNNTLTVNNQTINLNSKVKAIAGTTQYYEGTVIEKLGKNLMSEEYLSNSIYTGFVSTQNKTTTKDDIGYARSFNKGDIGIYNNPTVNGKAMWLCNRNNASNETYKTVGTITNVTSGTLTLTDITLEDYENQGIRLFNNCTVEGVTSGATAIITKVNYTENKLTSSYDLSNFIVGEKVQLKKTTYVRNGDYLYIPIINSGVTNQRPFKGLTVGQMYFDTTLNKPIWYKGSSEWVDATGTTV